MTMSDVKGDRKYTKDHEWARKTGAEVVVGITSFAVEQLGDITLVNVDVKPGDLVLAGEAFGTIESVKTLSDLFSPVSGTVLRVNASLDLAPETVNRDCWEDGWILAIEPSDATEPRQIPRPRCLYRVACWRDGPLTTRTYGHVRHARPNHEGPVALGTPCVTFPIHLKRLPPC